MTRRGALTVAAYAAWPLKPFVPAPDEVLTIAPPPWSSMSTKHGLIGLTKSAAAFTIGHAMVVDGGQTA
jgi:hypothetical protein